MHNPFRWRGSVPLEDLFVYKSGLKKMETPLHERHIALESKRENYPDYQAFLVGDKSQVWFSRGLNFLTYRQRLFAHTGPYFRDGGIVYRGGALSPADVGNVLKQRPNDKTLRDDPERIVNLYKTFRFRGG